MIAIGLQDANDSDNIKKEIAINIPASLTVSGFLAVINALPLFKISETELPIFKAITTDLEPVTYYVELLNVGKGTYGTGGLQLTAANVRITSSSATSTDIVSLPNTQIIDLGYIGDSVVWGLNIQVPNIIIQEQNEGYVLVKGIFENGEYHEYLWIGTGGAYGQDGGLQATGFDFKEMSSVTSGIAKSTSAYSGTVKTDTDNADPTVYIKETVDNLLASKANTFTDIKTITGITYNLVLDDTTKELLYEGTLPMDVIIPNNSTVPFPVGTSFYTFPTNTGILSTSAAVGVTLKYKAGLVLSSQQNELRKYTKIGVNTWSIDGSVAATGALEYKKCFLKSTGNDANAIIGSAEKPFLTLEGLIVKVLAVYGNFDDIKIIILDSGSYTISETRSYSDLYIQTNFNPTVRIANKTYVSRNLFFEGNMTLNLNARVGATFSGNYLLLFMGGVNSNLYFKIKEITKGSEGGSFAMHFSGQGIINKCFFEVGTLSGNGRFGFESPSGVQDFNIGNITAGTFELQTGGTGKLINVNVKNITYSGNGDYEPFAEATDFVLKIGNISVTNATARVRINFKNIRLFLDGGLYQNTIFDCVVSNLLEHNGYISGKGILEYKSALTLTSSVFNCTVGNTERSKNLKGVLFKDLDLIIRDTNVGAYINAGYVINSVVGNGANISPRFTLDNVRIEIKDSTRALFLSGFTALETNNYNIVLFKNGCHIINPNGYLFEWRPQFTGLTDATGKIVLAQIGKALIHEGLGISTFPNVTMTDLSTY